MGEDFLAGAANTDGFSENQKETMDAVLEYYGDKEPHWLSELTHKERPWKEARNNCNGGERCSDVITKESMQNHYASISNE